ncbi:MAG TPA: anti-sigma factor [Xanthobacteraceae bacterium]|nr:anti-sigma factor [Xanthobacteraceae bacterium]
MMRAATYEDATLRVHAYVDGELDPANALGVEASMASDPALAAERERIEAFRRLVCERLPRKASPFGLRARVEAAIGMRRPRTQPSWRALAASIAVTAILASGATSMLVAPLEVNAVREGIVDAHIRSLMARQPIDVASSDRHTVKPWFNGRIPRAPRVVDLNKEDFPLVGGRIDVIGASPVPTLVYGHGKHLISLTAVPAAGSADSAPASSETGGYNILRWIEDGIAYWAISDASATELDKFADLFRTTPPDQ